MVRQQVPHNTHVFARTRSRLPGPVECREELVDERDYGKRDMLDVVEAGADERDECVWNWGNKGRGVESGFVGYAGVWEGE